MTKNAPLNTPTPHWPARQSDVRAVAWRLRSRPLTVLSGPAGAQRSNALRDQLMPLLQRRASDSPIAFDTGGAVVLPFPDRRGAGRAAAAALQGLPEMEVAALLDNWSGDPIADLHAQLGTLLCMAPLRVAAAGDTLASRLQALSGRFAVRFLLVVDRFEDALHAAESGGACRVFIDQLAAVIDAAEPMTHVLLSASDDARPLLARFRQRFPQLDSEPLRLTADGDGTPPAGAADTPAAPTIAAAPPRARPQPGELQRPAVRLVPPAVDPRSPAGQPADSRSPAAGRPASSAAAPVSAHKPSAVAATGAEAGSGSDAAAGAGFAAAAGAPAHPAADRPDGTGISSIENMLARIASRAGGSAGTVPGRVEAGPAPGARGGPPAVEPRAAPADTGNAHRRHPIGIAADATPGGAAADHERTQPLAVDHPPAIDHENDDGSGGVGSGTVDLLLDFDTPTQAPTAPTPRPASAAPPRRPGLPGLANELPVGLPSDFAGASKRAWSVAALVAAAGIWWYLATPERVDIPLAAVIPSQPSIEPPAGAAPPVQRSTGPSASTATAPATATSPVAEPTQRATATAVAPVTDSPPAVAAATAPATTTTAATTTTTAATSSTSPVASTAVTAATDTGNGAKATSPAALTPANAPSASPSPSQLAAAAPPSPAVSALPSLGLAIDGDDSGAARLASDLVRLVGLPSGVGLKVETANGWADALAAPRDGQRLAVARYDALAAMRRDSPSAAIRLVTPLVSEELYFIARADSPLAHVHDIERAARINVGPAHGGRALTAQTVYQRLFDHPMLAGQASLANRDVALRELLVARSIDVMVVVDAQPSAWLARLPAEQLAAIKLLPLAPDHPTTLRARRTYLPAVLQAGATPVARDTPTLSMMSFLVVTGDVGRDIAGAPAKARTGADGTLKVADQPLDRAAGSSANRLVAQLSSGLCRQLDNLRREGHPKWRELQPGLPLPTGWPYAAEAAAAFRGCPAGVTTGTRAALETPLDAPSSAPPVTTAALSIALSSALARPAAARATASPSRASTSTASPSTASPSPVVPSDVSPPTKTNPRGATT